MHPLTVIHDPDVLSDRYALSSLAAYRNAHISNNSNATLRPIVGVSTRHQHPPGQR